MSDRPGAGELARREVLYRVAGTAEVTVRPDVPFGGDGGPAGAMDLYLPAGAAAGGGPLPSVVIVAGYPEEGFRRVMGCGFREMGSTVSWARLIAASGMVAIAYSSREPEGGAVAVLRHVRDRGAELGIDATRTGIWASSGNGPLALWLLMRETPCGLACAALCYPFLLDLDGAKGVTDGARAFGFAAPVAGGSADDLPRGVPLLVARAGDDRTPGLLEGLDGFVAAALARDLPLTLVNHAGAPHAFDLFDDSDATRAAIRQVLAFLRIQLRVEP